MVYGYIRVSTDKQTVENQRFEIEKFDALEGISVDEWVEETVSGTRDYSERALVRGFTQRSIACYLGVHPQTLSRFMHERMGIER